jgi:hypothetical protein
MAIRLQTEDPMFHRKDDANIANLASSGAKTFTALYVPATCITSSVYFIWLSGHRVAVTFMPPSVFFSLHPFANIGSTVLKLHAIRFAAREKAHYLAIDHGNVLQI